MCTNIQCRARNKAGVEEMLGSLMGAGAPRDHTIPSSVLELGGKGAGALQREHRVQTMCPTKARTYGLYVERWAVSLELKQPK